MNIDFFDIDGNILNRSALFWGMDDVIGDKGTLSGNMPDKAIRETIDLIRNLPASNTIINSLTSKYLNVINNSLKSYTQIMNNLNYTIKQSDEYLLLGWKGHAITVFYEYVNGKYNLGVINAGQGAEFQGIGNAVGNGIMIFKNIKKENLQEFMNMYINFYIKSLTDKEFDNNEKYYGFYSLIWKYILRMKNYENINFKNDSIEKIVVPLQKTGTCTFTNLLYILYYFYRTENKKLPGDKLLDNWNKWYDEMKHIIINGIRDNIKKYNLQFNGTFFYNIYQYCLDYLAKFDIGMKYVDIEKIEKQQEVSYNTKELNGIKIRGYVNPIVNIDLSVNKENSLRYMIYNGFRVKEKRASIDLDKEFIDRISKYNIFNGLGKEKIVDFLTTYITSNYDTKDDKFNQYKFNTEDSIDLLNLIYYCECLNLYLAIYDLSKRNIINIHDLADHINKYIVGYDGSMYTASFKNSRPSTEYLWKTAILRTVAFVSGFKLRVQFYDNNQVDKVNQNFQLYCLLCSDVPIHNFKEIKLYKEFINDLRNSISYLPDLTEKKNNDKINKYLKNSWDIYDTFGESLSVDFEINIKSYLQHPQEIENYKQNGFIDFGLKSVTVDKDKFIFSMFTHKTISNINFFENSMYLNYVDFKNIGIGDKENKWNIFYNFHIINGYTPGYENSKKPIAESTHRNMDIIEFVNPSGTIEIENKINLYFDKIVKQLQASEHPEGDIIKYFMYFYLCRFKNVPMVTEINTKYEKYLSSIAYSYPHIIDNLIGTYSLYCLMYNKEISMQTKFIKFDENIVMNDDEKIKVKHIKEPINTTKTIDGLYMTPININFYMFNVYDNIPVILLENKYNTKSSYDIIESLKDVHLPITFFIDFYYKKENGKIFGYNKNNDYEKLILTKLNNNEYDITYINNLDQYKVLYLDKDIQVNIKNNTLYDHFYKILLLNEEPERMFIFKDKNQSHYIKLTSFKNTLFKLSSDNIHYLRNDKFVTIDLYHRLTLFNFGCFMLSTNDILILFNHKMISKLYEQKKKNEQYFVLFSNGEKKEGKSKEDNKNIFEDNLQYLKVQDTLVINLYFDQILIKSKTEFLYLAINCLLHNAPRLLLKSLNYLIQMNNNIENLINLILKFYTFNNPYTLMTLQLISDKFNTYSSSPLYNKLYSIYSIPVKLVPDHTKKPLKYTEMSLKLEYDIDNEKVSKYMHIDKNIPTIDDFLNLAVYYKKSLGHLFIDKETPYFIEIRSYVETNVKNIARLLINKKNPSSIKSEYKEYNPIPDKDYEKLFTQLIKFFIRRGFNEAKHKENINKSIELSSYLINKYKGEKKNIYPIQEMIMGSGKSSTIAPYVTIDLIYKLSRAYPNDKFHIYHVMPETLVSQSFDSFIKVFVPIMKTINIYVYSSERGSQKFGIYQGKMDSTVMSNINLYISSDLSFKSKFINENLQANMKNSFVIYDEIDMMADPIRCELNFPDNENYLKNLDVLYNYIDKDKNSICYKLYYDIFDNDKFWNQINKNNVSNNSIHNYLLDLDDAATKYVHDAYDKITQSLMGKNSSIDNLVKHVKKYVLPFLLTKQYNFDYGVPSVYPDKIKDVKYKYKAIPYLAVDTPAYGSQFSDPVLTYVMTYICYNIMNKNGTIRSMDFEQLCLIYADSDEIDKLRKLFDTYILDIKIFRQQMSTFFLSRKKNVNLWENFDFFKIVVEDQIINYNQDARNVSMTDLLLDRYVPNYISFTGTAYVMPPQDIPLYANYKSYDYKRRDYIERTKIKSDNLHFNNVEETIKYIIDNQVTNIFSNSLGNQAINTLLDNLNYYNVLIDVGAFLLKYNVEDIKNNLRKNNKNSMPIKNYLIYVDDNIKKVIDLQTDKEVPYSTVNINMNDTFFYFSNRYITGIDFKDIMFINAKGIVTVSHSTTMRDFSQGVYRMRNILKEQTADLFVDYNTSILIEKVCEKESKNIVGGAKLSKVKVAKNCLYRFLQENQQSVINKQEKQLYKQNILGICKKDKSDNNILKINMFVDPSTNGYNINKSVDDYNVDSISKKKLDLVKNGKEKEFLLLLINNLIEMYYKNNLVFVYQNQNEINQEKVQDKINIKKNEVINEQVQVNIQFSQNKYSNQKMYSDGSIEGDPIYFQNKVYYASTFDLKLYDAGEFMGISLYDPRKRNIILYNKFNQIIIIDYIIFSLLCQFNNYTNLNENLFISPFNDQYYGRKLKDENEELTVKYIRIMCKTVLNVHFSTDEINIKQSQDYKNFINTYTPKIMSMNNVTKNIVQPGGSAKKYKLYKK